MKSAIRSFPWALREFLNQNHFLKETACKATLIFLCPRV